MKPKASEILQISKFSDFSNRKMEGYFIRPFLDDKNSFKTKEEVQNLINEWDKVEEYKEKMEAAKEALRSVIRHGIIEKEGYEDTLAKIWDVLDN